MKKLLFESFPHFLHGGDYNPEQWIDTKEIWDEDMRLMKLAGCNEMSVGIFSWSTLEPRENEYDFSFLDRILDKIYAAGGRVLLATPSGARPHWMADKYPEVLRVRADGQRNRFGRRHNHCFTSPYYRNKTFEMDTLLAKRYSKHPAVIGWHISNEFGGDCFCPLCAEAFRDFLRKKYDSDIKKLNFQWWTTFWSHTYADFSEVEPPSPIGDSFSSLELDWRRFVTEQTTDFLENEVRAIRQYSDLPVTTNFMQRYPQLNYNTMKRAVDVVSWDSYPYWHDESGKSGNLLAAADTAIHHDMFRALKQQPFMLMESTPSNTNWQKISKLKRPGMHKLACMQAVAHGADSVQYFQWRKSRGSNEKFHGAVVDHVGHENTRVFREVSEVGSTLSKIEEILATMPSVKVAVIFDTETNIAFQHCQGFQNENKKYYETASKFYYEFWKRSINVDVISASQDLSSYDVVVAPMLYMTPKSVIDSLESFVKNGGTLIATYALGMVNENDLCYLGGFPGENLKDVFGIWSEEVDTLYPEERDTISYGGKTYKICDYAERIHPRGAKVLASYTSDFFSGEPALTVNEYGKGKAYYIAARDTGEFKDALLSDVLKDLKVERNIKNAPEGVTAHSREDDSFKYLFVENYTAEAQEAELFDCGIDMESGENVENTITLSPFGVRIIKNKKS